MRSLIVPVRILPAMTSEIMLGRYSVHHGKPAGFSGLARALLPILCDSAPKFPEQILWLGTSAGSGHLLTLARAVPAELQELYPQGIDHLSGKTRLIHKAISKKSQANLKVLACWVQAVCVLIGRWVCMALRMYFALRKQSAISWDSQNKPAHKWSEQQAEEETEAHTDEMDASFSCYQQTHDLERFPPAPNIIWNRLTPAFSC